MRNVVLEKQRNNGLGCGNGISLTEVQPCCDTSRKNVVGAWGGISRTCNGSHWNQYNKMIHVNKMKYHTQIANNVCICTNI